MHETKPLTSLDLAGRPVRDTVLGVGVSRRLRLLRLFGSAIRLLWSTAYTGAMPSTRFQCDYDATILCRSQLPRTIFSHSNVASLGRGELRFVAS